MLPKTPKHNHLIGRRSAMLSLLTPPVRIMKPVNNNNNNAHVHKFETDNKRFASVVVYDESPDGHCVVMNQAIRWRSFGKQQDDDEFETKWNREVFLLDGTFV
jgi:hypothetical protein